MSLLREEVNSCFFIKGRIWMLLRVRLRNTYFISSNNFTLERRCNSHLEQKMQKRKKKCVFSIYGTLENENSLSLYSFGRISHAQVSMLGFRFILGKFTSVNLCKKNPCFLELLNKPSSIKFVKTQQLTRMIVVSFHPYNKVASALCFCWTQSEMQKKEREPIVCASPLILLQQELHSLRNLSFWHHFKCENHNISQLEQDEMHESHFRETLRIL